MKCEQCGHENRPGAHFCQECGTILQQDSAGTPQSFPPVAASGERNITNDPAVTQPLPSLQTAYEPLPKGALIASRYVIQSVPGSTDQSAQYVVEDLKAVRLCPNCRSVIDDTEEQYCADCGAEVSNIARVHLRYRLEETIDPRAFAAERQLLGLRLNYPGIRLPLKIFSETPYGPKRHYRLLPEFSAPTAVSTSIPQELNDVLTWCTDLAGALVHLHKHQVVLNTPRLDHIALEDKQASWVNLHQAYVLSPEDRGSTAQDRLVQDVQGLATICLYLATGQREPTSNLELPDTLQTSLSQAIKGVCTAQEFHDRLASELQEQRRPSSVLLEIGQKTDVGQVRTLNEDSLLTLQMTPVYRSKSQPIGIFVVADGMGGHEAGDVASHLTCQVIAQEAVTQIMSPATQEKDLPDPATWLIEVTKKANQWVYEERRAARSDMGTTLTMALMRGEIATIVNVGDSRAYHLTPETISQITTDHSLVERLVATGQITREEAVDHPQKNVIYRVMGDRSKVESDVFEQRLQIGEGLLLCSDGLSGMIDDNRIWHIWNTSYSPQDVCERLIEEANQAGGEDNVTVVVIQATHA